MTNKTCASLRFVGDYVVGGSGVGGPVVGGPGSATRAIAALRIFEPRRLFCFLMLLLFVGCSDSFDSSEQFDFRNTRWGMSMEEVKKRESASPLNGQSTATPDILFYIDEIEGMPCSFDYAFSDNKLKSAAYFFYENGKIPFVGYAKLAAALVAKYGEPVRSEKRWAADEQNPSGFILLNEPGGCLEEEVIELKAWHTETTEIQLRLYSGGCILSSNGDVTEPAILLEYSMMRPGRKETAEEAVEEAVKDRRNAEKL